MKVVTFNEVLERIIAESRTIAFQNYENDINPQKLTGCIEGLDACRNKDVDQLRDLYKSSYINSKTAMKTNKELFWQYRCLFLEVEWVCAVMSAYNEIAQNNEQRICPIGIKATMKADEIISELTCATV